jgi:predicted nuclease with RNAse H fold
LSFVGIDVGARRFHVATIDADVVALEDVDAVVARCTGAVRIAIDAPAEPATGRVHGGNHSPKFAVARCNEIAAGEQLGVWVPWVTPTLTDSPEWMLRGFALWDALRAAGHGPIEVYPAGCFWLLNGRQWPPKKSTPDGRAARRALLAPHLVTETDVHHELDALMAAVVARGPSHAVGHRDDGCDGSTIWVLD